MVTDLGETLVLMARSCVKGWSEPCAVKKTPPLLSCACRAQVNQLAKVDAWVCAMRSGAGVADACFWKRIKGEEPVRR